MTGNNHVQAPYQFVRYNWNLQTYNKIKSGMAGASYPWNFIYFYISAVGQAVVRPSLIILFILLIIKLAWVRFPLSSRSSSKKL